MKSLITTSLAACFALSTGLAMAQDATKSTTKMEAKKEMTMQECKDHMNEMKGQKRTDPATAETKTKCEAMMKNSGKMNPDGSKATGGMGSSNMSK